MSHLLQMRGLKHLQDTVIRLQNVASFTDAWIETGYANRCYKSRRVASFTDAWIETYKEIIEGRFDVVASFTDAWIETSYGCPEDAG